MDDMLSWAGIPNTPTTGNDLTAGAQPAPELPDPRLKKSRHRPNNGRIKRTDRNPPLVEPPWDMLRATGYPVPGEIENLPYTPINWREGTLYQKWQKGVFARWGRTCHLCGHEGADSADHLVPVSVWNNQPYDTRLARPAHGVAGCPVCRVKCNSSRGNREFARQIRDYKPPVAL